MSRKKKDYKHPAGFAPAPSKDGDRKGKKPSEPDEAKQGEKFTVNFGEAEKAAPEKEEPTPSADEKIAELEAELTMAKERVLRCAAELENYKKRMAREMTEERRYALLPLMRDILPVLDNMGRAIETVEQGHDPSHLLEGVKLVNDQLKSVLAKYDCVEIDSLHRPFDPHLHKAILQQPNSEVEPNTVLGVTQAGYCLHDRVVRPSNVIVSKLEDGGQKTEDSES